MSHEAIRWLITAGLAILGFVLGGGWPARAYRKWSDLDLVERMRPHFWLRTEQDAFERQNDMRHDRTDEMTMMIRDGQRAVLQLTGAVERASEGVKYAHELIQEVRDEVEELKRGRPPSP